jgi:hypothetical protein
VRPLGLALFLAALPGCSPADNNLWPSIEPMGSRATGAMAAQAAPSSSSLLPTNPWELAGGLGLILGCGGLAVVVWKGVTVQRRVEALQNSAETLARRRDSGTADLVQLSRKVSELNQQVRSLKAELNERPLQPPAAPQARIVQRPAPAPAPVAATPPAAPASAPPAQVQAQVQVHAQALSLPPLVPPPPPQAVPAPRPPAGPATAAPPRAAAVAARPLPPPPAPEPAPAPEPVLARALDVLRQATLEPSTPAMPEPAPSVPAPSGITLQDLINAVNGRGNRQIEGVSFAQLDPADFNSSEGIGLPQSPRLRLVGSGGRFLMVFFDDDSWLFPAVTTLETYSRDPSEAGYYSFEQAPVTSAELSRPAQLREAGGLWEVIEPGLVLVPKA